MSNELHINILDAVKLTPVRADVIAALNEVASKYGLKMSVGRIDYSDTTFSFKVSGVMLGADSHEAVRYKRNAGCYNVDPESLGKPIAAQGRTVYIAGMEIGGIIVAEDSSGNRYRMKASTVATHYPAGCFEARAVQPQKGSQKATKPAANPISTPTQPSNQLKPDCKVAGGGGAQLHTLAELKKCTTFSTVIAYLQEHDMMRRLPDGWIDGYQDRNVGLLKGILVAKIRSWKL